MPKLTAHKCQSAGEKIRRQGWWAKAGTKKWLKRKSNKRFRSWARIDPEAAPRKMPIRGWID